MARLFKTALIIFSIIQLILAAGFAFQVAAVTAIWPLPDTTPLSFLFIGSIFAAAGAAQLYCLYIRENGALVGIALDYITIFVPLIVFMLQIANGSSAILAFAVSLALGLAFGVALLFWSRQYAITDPRPQPRLVRYSFVVFIVALLLVGGSLVLKTPNVLPWRITTEGGVVYGWMFLGAAAYFTYSLLRPSWINSGGQLMGFLAYDVVLIVPFVTRLATVDEQYRLGLYVYTAVVAYSGLMAAYFLFIHPTTRMFGARAGTGAVMGAGGTASHRP
ncbi:MAG: hypothetical protein KME04_14310 [Pleurocapsa minor GSE-CHR-MK-17-07R]|jgi:hypothetical protein|nr:hypothetical protein [Pleurocapsa minor GSE-CHR-MK 17-07R]